MTAEETKVLAKCIEVAASFADEVVKPPLAELGELFAQSIGHWRLKNRVNFILKIKKYLEEQGVKPTKMLPDIFVPLIEEASNAEDETLSEMFARLGATHLDAEQAGKAHPSFAKTLGQLSPLDVRILRMIDAACEENHKRIFHNAKLPRYALPGEKTATAVNAADVKREIIVSRFGIIDQARSQWKVTADQAGLSMTNLERLGLIKERQTNVQTVIGSKAKTWIVTNYAKSLQSACSKPGTYWWHKIEGINEKIFDENKASAEKFYRDLAAGKFDNEEDSGDEDPETFYRKHE